MNRSENYDALIDALLEGRASTDETARLLAEGDGDEIEELAELVETLSRIDPDLAKPSDEQLAAVRRSVMARLEAEQPADPRRALPRWLPIAAALGAFAIGLAAGKGTRASEPQPLTFTDLVTRSALADGSNGDFRYSNLRLEEVDGENVELTVDVETELALRRPMDDLLVSDILASSLINEPSLGTRLKLVRHAGRSPRVRRALIAVALDDPDVSVRLRALERLTEQDAQSPDVQDALLTVVASEESVAMRLHALEALADDVIDYDLIETLDEGSAEGGAAVLWRARQRLNRRSL